MNDRNSAPRLSLNSRRTGRRRPALHDACVEMLESRRLLSFSQTVDYYGSGEGRPVAGDFNNDGRFDLASPVGVFGNAGSILLGKSDGTFESGRHSGAAGDSPVAAGDLNGDGNADLVTTSLSVLLGNGDGTFRAPRATVLPAQFPPGYTGSTPLPQAPNSAVVGDVNADGKLDLIAGGGTSLVVGSDEYGYPVFDRHGYANVLLGSGDGTFGQSYSYLVTSHVGVHEDSWDTAPVKALADFDGDGRSDVLVSAYVDGRLLVFTGNGDGTLKTPLRETEGPSRTVALVAADFDSDGKLDVLTGASVMSGNGDGTFEPTAPLDFGAGVSSVAVADVNVDGKPDIVGVQTRIVYFSDYGADTTRYAHTMLGRGDGSFDPPAVSPLGTVRAYSTIRSAVLADFDGNGFPDLALSEARISEGGMASGVVAVAHNVGDSVTKNWIGPAESSWSHAANWSPSGVPTAADHVAISGRSVSLDSGATIASLTLTSGATLAVATDGNRVLRTSSLSIISNSKLNLNDNDLILDYSGVSPVGIWTGSAYDGVTGMIQSGRITTSLGSDNLKAFGLAEAREALGITGTQTATFASQAVDATSVLVKYTYAGDATLDGIINIDDYGHIDSNVGTPGASGWFNGDFNYDGKINIDDYGIIDSNIVAQGEPFLAASFATTAAVPSSSNAAEAESRIHAPALLWSSFPAISDDEEELAWAVDRPVDEL